MTKEDKEIKDQVQRSRRLTLQKIDGTITEQGVQELSELLFQSKAARIEYTQLSIVHAELEWRLGGKSSEDAQLAWRQQNPASSDRLPKTSLPTRQAFRIPKWLTRLAIAASLFAIVSVAGWMLWPRDWNDPQFQLTGQGPELNPVVGTLDSLLSNSIWSFGRPGQQNSIFFEQGDTIWLRKGAAELRLVNGVIATLDAPLIMQVVSADRVRLIQGGMKVEVPENARGFSVETASAEVVDLGTVFSVNVSRESTHLVVFDGLVDLLPASSERQPSQSGPGSAKRFIAGEAVKVDASGTLSRIIEVRQSITSQPNARDGSIIASVRDNNQREDFWNFYEIVPGGMNEDAPAFADRHHQWNGSTSQGMPSYLVGGDYVKTFNDDKVDHDLKIDVTLSQPATCYVLLDDRVEPPKWLRESFEDTGDNVGVDEAPFDFDPNRSGPPTDEEPVLGEGAGKSIDQVHSIWRRDMPNGGTITMEANGRPTASEVQGARSYANMYGFVAVPLKK